MVGTFCTKRKGRKRKGLKGQTTQVNEGRVQDICDLLTQVKEGRVQDICDLLTQVKEGRVQVICKLLTRVNKGRVQVKVVAPGQQGQGIHYSYRNQFSKLEGFNRIFKFYSQESGRRNRGNQFFQSDLETRDETRQNTRFRAKENDQKNQFFKS